MEHHRRIATDCTQSTSRYREAKQRANQTSGTVNPSLKLERRNVENGNGCNQGEREILA